MAKVLVLYYSRTGITKKLAKTIADYLSADIEEIIDTKKRSGWMGYLIAGKDAAQKKQTNIQDLIHDPSAYDMVCIGTPVRDFTMSSAIRTFLTVYEKKLPASIILFCTQASAGAESTFQDMANIIGKKPLATIVCTTKNISKDNYQSSLQDQLAQAGLWID